MRTSFLLIVIIMSLSCSNSDKKLNEMEQKIIFLHHSTGKGVWEGNPNKILYKINKKGDVQKQISSYNKSNNANYEISEMVFPKSSPYGWKNYPYDYYNIWVKNAGDKPYMEEPTLEILTKEYNVIVFKHCFPVSGIEEEQDTADVNSELKTISNYKLQYNALKEKLQSFEQTKFVVWTGAALTKENTNEQNALRAKEFFDWVKDEWDQPNDNIFIWDFYNLETEGGLYLKDEYAYSPSNSHPNIEFNSKAGKLFVNRLIDIIEHNGARTNLKGESF